MTGPSAGATVAPAPARDGRGAVLAPLVRRWPLGVGVLALALPTILTLGRESWSNERGAHGPFVLITGLWLLWREWPRLPRRAEPASAAAGALAALAIGLLLAIYVFGRAYDFLVLEAGALYAIGVVLLWREFGGAALAAAWFPLLYLALAVPPPGSFLDAVTAPLKTLVSWLATETLHAAGLPIARQGVVLMVAQYQLLVADACSGLNSLIGLTSTALLYVHLAHRASRRYALAIVAAIVPIAVAANLIRVIILVLLTLHAGEAVAQGFLHQFAGVLVYVVALTLVLALDGALRRLIGGERR